MRVKRLILTAFALAVLLSLNSASAVTFDVGRKVPGEVSDVSDNGYCYYRFDSNCSVYAKPYVIDKVHLILDGDENTGLDHNTGGPDGGIAISVYFPFQSYVENITVKNSHNGSACDYTLTAVIRDGEIKFSASTQRTFDIHNFMIGLRLTITSLPGYQYNFQDILFNYIPAPTTLEEVQQAIQLLFQMFDELENQFDNLTLLVENLYELVESINGTVNNINITQQEILGDIVNIWSAYEVLNQTVIELSEQYMYLNNSFIEETTIIQNDLDDIRSNISIIESMVQNLGDDLTLIQELRDTLNSTLEDITILEGRVTALESAVPDIYDDRALKGRIAELEAENALLKGDIGNLTGELEAMEPQFESLNDEIANLTSRLRELEEAPPVGDPKDEKEGGADEDTDLSLLVIIAFILGLVGIILGTAAMYRARKGQAKGQSEGDTDDPEEPSAPPPAQEPSSGEGPSAPVEENAGVNTYQITGSADQTGGGGQPAPAQPAVMPAESPAQAPPAPPPV